MKAYRYTDILYSSGDEDYGYHTHVQINLLEFEVVKETLKGIWIEDILKRRRFINLNLRKKYACLSKEDATVSFISRKKAQIKILKNQLRNAESALSYMGVKENEHSTNC